MVRRPPPLRMNHVWWPAQLINSNLPRSGESDWNSKASLGWGAKSIRNRHQCIQMRKWKEFKLTNLLTPDVASCMCVRYHQVQNYGSMRNVERIAWSAERGAWSAEQGVRSAEWGARSAEWEARSKEWEARSKEWEARSKEWGALARRSKNWNQCRRLTKDRAVGGGGGVCV